MRPPVALIQSDDDYLKPIIISPIRRVVVVALKGIAGIAAVVAIFCPLGSWTQILTFVGSAVLALICLFALTNLDDNYID